MPRATRKSLTVVVAAGDTRASLEALRDHLAAELSGGTLCAECGGSATSATAPLAKQLLDVLRALDAFPSKKASTVDEVAAKRAARIAAAKVPDGTGRRQQRRPRSS